jgi:hypothetical protein
MTAAHAHRVAAAAHAHAATATTSAPTAHVRRHGAGRHRRAERCGRGERKDFPLHRNLSFCRPKTLIQGNVRPRIWLLLRLRI